MIDSRVIQKFVEDMTEKNRVLIPYESRNGKYSGPAIVAKTWEDLIIIAKATMVLLEADPITEETVVGNKGFFAYPRF